MELAATGSGGFMSTIQREPGFIYNVRYDKVPLELVANSERTFPASWILPSGSDVSDEFVRYAKPLVGEDMLSIPMIGGRQRLTQFKPIFAEKKLPSYVPEADRK
jgi:6-phosphofructokinase 1